MTGNANARVSVIIPARNEETNIARVVRTVAAQQGVREILVVDDQSSDRTGEILEGLKAEIPSLRSFRVQALPEGWLGKSYALATAAQKASGDWLLFTDADTDHLLGSLAALLEFAERRHADLLSVSPGQVVLTWWEKSVIPLVYVKLARLYRFEEVSDPNSPVAAANGQYLLIRRETYRQVGGHEAVRGEILEDVELAHHVKAAGGRLEFLSGAAWVRTRMYRTFNEMWRGWTKNLYLLYRRDLATMLADLASLWLFDLLPALAFIALGVGLALEGDGTVKELGAVACLLLVLARLWSYSRELRRLGFDPHLAWYGPLGALLFSVLLLNSLQAHRLTGRVQWKGRAYSTRG
jgi:glycosyltransferase involved in cell wall biosynthesis